MTPAQVLQEVASRIDQRDSDGLAALLAPGFGCRYVHTGETFDAEGWVRLNREYPGTFSFTCEDSVACGDRAAGLARVSGGGQTHHVAMFLTVRDGLATDLVEVWTDGLTDPPPERRPA